MKGARSYIYSKDCGVFENFGNTYQGVWLLSPTYY